MENPDNPERFAHPGGRIQVSRRNSGEVWTAGVARGTTRESRTDERDARAQKARARDRWGGETRI